MVPDHQAKVVLGTINCELEPYEIRKFKFIYQNSGNSQWTSDVKLIRVSGDSLEIELIASQNEVNPGDYLMVQLTVKTPPKPGKYISIYSLFQ